MMYGKKESVIGYFPATVIANAVKQSRQVVGNAKIATALSRLAMTGKKSVIANAVKQSRQVTGMSSSAYAGDPESRRRHPEFISGSTNGSIWTLRQAQSDGADGFIQLDSRMLVHSRMTAPFTRHPRRTPGIQMSLRRHPEFISGSTLRIYRL